MKIIKLNKNIIIGVIILIVTSLLILYYWIYTNRYPTTNNAYVKSGITYITPKVSGSIKNVYIKNNQYVHKGDLLIEVDPSQYEILYKKSLRNYALSKQQLKLSLQEIQIAKANYEKANLEYELSQKLSMRYDQLYKRKSGSLQDKEKYNSQYEQSKQTLEQSLSDVKKAEILLNISIDKSEIAKMTLDNSKLNLSYTKIYANSDGYIGNLNMLNGQFISKGQKIFVILDNTNWWIDANYKETQLESIRVGQPAKVSLDMYPYTYNGTVLSVSYGSGNTYALLPAQNASGNWVKVTQRFTVRIKIDNNKYFPLRVGASASVKVDTTK